MNYPLFCGRKQQPAEIQTLAQAHMARKLGPNSYLIQHIDGKQGPDPKGFKKSFKSFLTPSCVLINVVEQLT